MATGSGPFKILQTRFGLHPVDVAAAASWGVAAATGALWIVQPFDWLKKHLFEKPEPEK